MTSAELQDLLYPRIFEAYKAKGEPPRQLPCTQEEYNGIWLWYRENNLIPIIDMELAMNGFTNLVMLGVAWYVS